MQLTTRCGKPSGFAAQQGVMLIEVLVAMVLSAVALLALASVTAASLRYTKMSEYRAVATLLAQDMAERMRANQGGLAHYSHSSSFASPAPTSPPTACDATDCTPAAMAAQDLLVWRWHAQRLLPQGAVHVVPQPASQSVDLWIAWRDPLLARSDEAPATASECPSALAVTAADGVRCFYGRVHL